VTFTATDDGTFPGHAMVIVGVEDAKTKTSSYKAFGFYPHSSRLGAKLTALFGSVPGEIVDEVVAGRVRIRIAKLIVRVNSWDHQKVEKIIASGEPSMITR